MGRNVEERLFIFHMCHILKRKFHKRLTRDNINTKMARGVAGTLDELELHLQGRRESTDTHCCLWKGLLSRIA